MRYLFHHYKHYLREKPTVISEIVVVVAWMLAFITRVLFHLSLFRVCQSVCVSVPCACPDYCTYPDVTWSNGRGYPLVVHCWADLQSVHRFRCYDNIHVCNTLQMLIAACVFVCLSAAACPHYCTDPDVTWRNGRGAPSCALLGRFAIGARVALL